MKCKYNVISRKTGKLEPWSGEFPSETKAIEWYRKHGVKHEAEGRTLVMMRVGEPGWAEEGVRSRKKISL